MDYPEHDKLMRHRKEADAIGGFLEFLESKDIVLASRAEAGECCGWCGLRRAGGHWAALIGEYLEIDPERLEMEKRTMLENMRSK